MMQYTVTEDIEVVLNGQRYCLERGDIIVTENHIISEGVLDILLDAGGLIPGIGEPIDFVNGVRHLLQGNLFYAAVSFISMIPAAGDSSKILKYIAKYGGKGGAKVSKAVKKLMPKIDELWESAGQAVRKMMSDDRVIKLMEQSDELRNAASQVTDNWDEMGRTLKSKLQDYAEQKKQEGSEELKRQSRQKKLKKA